MNKTALLCLQWTLGVVLFIEAALLAFSPAETHFANQAGIHHLIRLVIAWAEMLACILLLIPRTLVFGAKLLIAVIAVAALVHILHGTFHIGPLLIYASAAWVVLSQSPRITASPSHD